MSSIDLPWKFMQNVSDSSRSDGSSGSVAIASDVIDVALRLRCSSCGMARSFSSVLPATGPHCRKDKKRSLASPARWATPTSVIGEPTE